MKATLVSLLFSLLSHLPLSWTGSIGRAASAVVRRFPIRAYRVATTNIAMAFPELDEQQQAALVQETFANTMTTALDMPIVWRHTSAWAHAHTREVYGETLVTSARKAGRGTLFICPHLGNWEVFGQVLPRFGPTTCLYQPPKFEAVETLVRAGRERSGATLVPTTPQGIGKLLKALKRGEQSLILPDQVPQDGSGIFAPFFGHDTYTMTLLSNLARKTGCVLILAYAIKVNAEEGPRFDIYFEAVPDTLYEEDQEVAIAAMNTAIESAIRKHPTAYQWAYKRFKRQPDGSDPYRRDGRHR